MLVHPYYLVLHYGPVLLTACASANRLFALKLYCQVLLKTCSDELALKRCGHSYFFVPDLIEYTFVAVALSDAKFMGGEYSNESRKAFY